MTPKPENRWATREDHEALVKQNAEEHSKLDTKIDKLFTELNERLDSLPGEIMEMVLKSAESNGLKKIWDERDKQQQLVNKAKKWDRFTGWMRARVTTIISIAFGSFCISFMGYLFYIVSQLQNVSY